MRVTKQLDGKPSKNLPKILVTEPTGHDDLLNFLSVYQTQDYFKGPHYHPEGVLCWYACNKYGEPSGEVIFARKVPVKELMWSFSVKKKYRMEGFNRSVKFKNVFSREPRYEDYKTLKPRLYQSVKKTEKGKKKNGNKNR